MLIASNKDLEDTLLKLDFVQFLIPFKYMSLGLMNLNFTGVNRVSQESAIYPVAVTKGPCFKPTIEVAKQNPCWTDELCRKGHRVSICCLFVKSCDL